MTDASLRQRDIEVLDDLIYASGTSPGPHNDGWVKAMDCGGRDGNDVSYRLKRLCQLGLAETNRSLKSRSRRNRMYRMNEAGRKRLELHRKLAQ